jgi:hypothetical protein
LGQHIKFDRPDKGREAIHEQGEPIWGVLYLDAVNITAGKMETVMRLNVIGLLALQYCDQEGRKLSRIYARKYCVKD